MVRPVHVCVGVVFLQPQSTVLMAYQPGGSGAPVFSPTVSPGCVTDPARAGTAVQSDRAPAAANFVHLLFICKLPSPPRRRSVADRSAEPHLVYGQDAAARWCRGRGNCLLAPFTDGLFWELLPKCCDTNAPTHVTGPSCKLSKTSYRRPTMVLPILAGTSGNVAPRTHIKSHEVRLVWSTFAAAV